VVISQGVIKKISIFR